MFVSASNKFTSNWMTCGFNPSLPINLSDDEFSDAIKLRLLVPIVPPDWSSNCSCGASPASDPFHCFACKDCLEGTGRRHNAINRQLRNFISANIGCYTGLEQVISHTENPDNNKRCDLVVRYDNGYQDLIDVTVVYPGAASYTSGNNIIPNRANERREKEKSRDYYTNLGPILSNLLIPFSMETTGNFGDKALKYIEKVSSLSLNTLNIGEKKEFLSHKLRVILSTTLMKYNSQIIQSSKLNFKTYLHSRSL